MLSLPVVRSFIGRDDTVLNGSDSTGNSILAKLKGNKYVFIGGVVFSFEPLHTIVSFNSPIGNNDVPYPWSRDKRGNWYLFVAGVIILATPENIDRLRWYENPYDYYYKASLLTPDRAYIPPQQPLVSTGITHFHAGSDTWTLRWSPSPQRVKGPLSITTTSRQRKPLTIKRTESC